MPSGFLNTDGSLNSTKGKKKKARIPPPPKF